MKTNQLILAAALVALAACGKENLDLNRQDNLDNEIGFNVVNKKATKANNEIITGTTYATDNTFKVWGWKSDAADYSEFAEDDASNFMSNLTISWNDGHDHARAEAWRNAEHYYYWPFVGKIAFLAVHPSTVAPSTTGWDATNDKPKATFADYTIAAGNKTVDLMLADNDGSKTAAALPLVFNHALAQIQFRIRTNSDYSADVTFAVNSVTINNIDLSGDLAYANGAFEWTDNAAQTENWAYYATSQNAAYPTDGLDANAALYGDANLMIPQLAYNPVAQVGEPGDPGYVAPVAGTTITINYTMTPATGAAQTNNVVVSAPQAWVAGKKYIYTLNFRLDEILFSPTATDWVDVVVSTINI